MFITLKDESTMAIRLCAEKRAPSYPTTAYSRDKEQVRQKSLEHLIKIGKASLNSSRKVHIISKRFKLYYQMIKGFLDRSNVGCESKLC